MASVNIKWILGATVGVALALLLTGAVTIERDDEDNLVSLSTSSSGGCGCHWGK